MYIAILCSYDNVYVFSVFVGDCKLIVVHLIIYSLAKTVCIHFYYYFEYSHDGGGHMYKYTTEYVIYL